MTKVGKINGWITCFLILVFFITAGCVSQADHENLMDDLENERMKTQKAEMMLKVIQERLRETEEELDRFRTLITPEDYQNWKDSGYAPGYKVEKLK